MGASQSTRPSAFLFRVTQLHPTRYVWRYFWTEQRARAWVSHQSGTFEWELVKLDAGDVTDHGMTAPAEVRAGAKAKTVHAETGWFQSAIRMGVPEDPDDVGPGAVRSTSGPTMTVWPVPDGHGVTLTNA